MQLRLARCGDGEQLRLEQNMMDFVPSLLSFQLRQDCVEQQLREAYLARATTVCDLDRMSRELDRRGSQFN